MSWHHYYYEPSRPRKITHGILPKTQRGDFGASWWAGKFLSLLNSYGWENRLLRGKRYARGGQVADMKEYGNGIVAHVQGSRASPYAVSISFKRLTAAQWKRVIAAMGAQAVFAAKLLAGEMPPEIEKAFQQAGFTLFPKSEKDVDMECSCPDWAVPCKHLAAVFYLLAERFDEDPFLLFRLRGIGREKVLAQLRRRRGVRNTALPQKQSMGEPRCKPIPLAKCLKNFWQLGGDLKSVTTVLNPVPIDIPLIKRAGVPPYWRGKKEEAMSELIFLYKSVAETVRDEIG